MKNLVQFVRWAIPVISCGMLLASTAYAQGGIRVAPGTAVESRRLLTNESVVQMVKQGEPDPAIIAAIRTNPVKFDLSRQQRLALHHEGVSEQVLNAMVTAELRRRKGLGAAVGPNAGELSPQPYPPKSRVNAAGQANKAELSPQPYPPKNGMPLTPGAQQTMLGTQANSPSGGGSESTLLGAQRPAIAGATKQGATMMSSTAGERNAIPGGNGGAGIRQHHGGANSGGNGGAGIKQHHGGANPGGNGGAGIKQHHGGANPGGNGGAGIKQHHGAILRDGSVRPDASTAATTQEGALSGTGTTAVTTNQATATMPIIMQKTSPVAVGASQPTIAQGNSGKLGAPPPTITLGGAPKMRPAPTSSVQLPAAPNSPLSTSGTAAKSLSNVAIANSIPSFLSVTKTAGDTALQSKQVLLSPTPGAQGNASSNAVSPPTPSKGQEPNKYESMTLQRGVTQDKAFSTWANSAQASTSAHELPAPPPIKSNPQRDASPPANAATKAQTKVKLDAQFATFKKATPIVRVLTKTAEASIPEIRRLKRQKMFVEALRKQAGMAPLAVGGTLRANSRAMAATQPPQTNRQIVIGSARAPISATPAGSLIAGGGTPLLSNRVGTNQAGSKTVAAPTITASAPPTMRQAPTVAVHLPAAPSSLLSNSGIAAKSLSNVRLAAGSVSGYVLWDTSIVHYQRSASCQGLKVTISTSSNGSLQTLAGSISFTTPFGSQPVWNSSGQGSQGPWMACAYVFSNVPEEVPLQVDAVVAQPSAFTPSTSFAPMQENQFELPGGNCNSTPQSTLAVVLNSGSILCGDYAFNVNFAGLNSRFNAALTNTKICFGTQIYTVNGVNRAENASNPVVFTQEPAYNGYIITGCGFGNTEGGQVYLSAAVTGGRINMTVLQWTPTMIEAEVQPGLTGVLDGWPDLIVVPPGGGTPGKFPNCRFYAQRQSVLLLGIPQQYVRQDNEPVGDATHGFGTMYCPGPDMTHLFPCVSFNYSYPLDGVTNNPSERGRPSIAVSNAVDRDGGALPFSPGEDVYNLSYLTPGFGIDYFRVHWYTWSQSACDDFRINEMKAGDTVNWSYEGRLDQYFQKGSQIIVDWPVDYCTSNWIGLFQDFSYYNSGYSLEVYVKGPIGVDPWTGQPTASH